MIQSRLHIKIIILVLIVLLGLSVYYFLKKNNTISDFSVKENSVKCISDGLGVSYEKDSFGIPIFPLEINVVTEDKKYKSFTIEDIKEQSSAVRLGNCNVYVIKGFGFDEKNGVILKNYSNELWRYDFKGSGEKIIQLNQDFKENKYNILYKLSFLIDSNEKKVALVNKYLGSEDYALHIKDIETKENVIEVNLTSDLFKKYPNTAGDVELRGWDADEKYFWFSLFDQANVLAYVRVNMENNNFEVFEAPAGTMNQDAFNMNTGWVTYDDGPPWSGMQEFDQEYQEEWNAENKKVNFYLYNLFTKEQILLDSQSDVTLWHYPKWIDDKTLEYTTSGGEVHSYKVD